MPRLIEVIVAPTGETTIQTKGYHGTDCLRASMFLEQALGIAARAHNTSEYYQPMTAPQSQIQQ